MIKIENLTVQYGDNIVFNKANAYFEKGFSYGILGLNGAGKTTLLNVLYKLKEYNGLITIEKGKLDRSKISYLPSENYFYYNLTGRDYLNIFPKPFDKNVIHNFELLFNLPLDNLIKEYSSGMKKKLALIGVLLLNRDIVIFDEPFGNLDIESVYVFKEIVEKLKYTGRTILISSHITDVLKGVCDKFFFLEDQTINEISDSNNLYIESKIKDKYHDIIKQLQL